MHPIERLRFVARASGLDDATVALEATAALVAFAGDPTAMVPACRQLLSRQPGCGPLWWACARLLTSTDVWASAQETIALLEQDRTESALAAAMSGPHGAVGSPGRQDRAAEVAPTVSWASALGRGTVLLRRSVAPGGSAGSSEAAADQPRGTAAARWLVAPVGTRLAGPLWDSLRSALSGPGRRGAPGPGHDDPLAPRSRTSTPEFVELASFTHVVCHDGLVAVGELAAPDCPVAPELANLRG